MKRLLGTRWLVALVSGLIVFSVVYAVAASLSVSSEKLSAGTATVSSCDSDGVTTSYAVAYDALALGYEVSSVTVGGIADACLNHDFSVTLATGTTSLATVSSADVATWTSTAVNANTLTLSFASSDVAASSVTAVYVAISD